MLARHGRIDVLFNNAGISAVGVFHDVPRAVWDAVLAVNVTGVYLVSRAIVRFLRVSKFDALSGESFSPLMPGSPNVYLISPQVHFIRVH